MANENNYEEAVARHLESRKLHRGARPGRRCRCGACRHQILRTARRAGLAPQRLIGALAPEREPEPQVAVKPRPLGAPVAETVTGARGGQREVGAAALFILAGVR
jgi:hypothetical protein